MRPLKLHTKTTLLASAITVAVMAAMLIVVSNRAADIVRDEQKARIELQAISLATQISQMPAPRDQKALVSVASLVHNGRPSHPVVRVWARSGGDFDSVVSVGDLPPGVSQDLPEETKAALRSGLESNIKNLRPAGNRDTVFRVAAPIVERDGSTRGAVEVIERLDDAPSIARRLERTAAWIALAAVVLITFANYTLFRRFVHAPVERLLVAMSQAEAGDLETQVPVRAPDELGLLSRGFNRMIERLRRMTEEREERRRALQKRVEEATHTLKERNEQLLETNRELWQTSRRLTELERLAAAGQTAAQFAHEVGTPLNLISGHVQLLRAGVAQDEKAVSRLQTIAAQIERIERIVRRMLDRTRPEAVELAPLDANALLQRTFEAIAPALEARSVRLESALAEGLPLIAGDADRLQQTFINFINNALDAMPDGGTLRVTTGVEETTSEAGADGAKDHAAHEADAPLVEAKRVFIEFADTGCGMSAEVRARIFDPYFTTKERGRGTGLGLVVVKQVMREHGGEVEVESEENCGARFRLRFPAQLASETEDNAAKRDESPQTETEAALTGD